MYRGEPTKSFVEISTLIAAFDSAKGILFPEILLSAFGREVENSSGSEGGRKNCGKVKLEEEEEEETTLRKRRSWKLILKEFETVCLALSDSSKRVQENYGNRFKDGYFRSNPRKLSTSGKVSGFIGRRNSSPTHPRITPLVSCLPAGKSPWHL